VWLLQRAGSSGIENVNANLNANINTNLNTSLNLDANFNFNTNINANVNANANMRTPTPTPRPSPSPSVSPSPADEDVEDTNSNTRPPATPSPQPSPTVRTPATPSNRVVNGGVLNGRAISLSTPAYPPAARQMRAAGPVMVEVSVDEAGRVVSARAVSGHPLLRSSAEAAARQSRINPLRINNENVKTNGVLIYNFRDN
jgi:protein TonB